MATMTDVAKRAGVSLSTVSYALSGSRPISEPTRQRILDAMRDLDFTPNAMAQGLRGQRTRIVGLMLPADETRVDAFTAEIVVGAAERARETGHHLLLWTEPAVQSTSISTLLKQGIVDGVILLSVQIDDRRVTALQAEGVPLAMIGCTESPGKLAYVDTDARQTTDETVRYLAELGHRSIAYIASHEAEPDRGYGIGVRLHDGMMEAGHRYNVHVQACFVEWTAQAAADAVVELFNLSSAPTAIVTIHDQLLAGVLMGATAVGRSVPTDVSVVGMHIPDQVATLLTPQVTTVCPDPTQIGRRGAAALIEQLEWPNAQARQELIPSRLTVRSSTTVARSYSP